MIIDSTEEMIRHWLLVSPSGDPSALTAWTNEFDIFPSSTATFLLLRHFRAISVPPQMSSAVSPVRARCYPHTGGDRQQTQI
jgi:hypothetical protein